MHSISLFLLSTLVVFALTYDRGSVVNYAATFWNNPNHDCNGGYLDCSPYSYFGGEHCGYPGQGGDCANFVSQSILAGGHPAVVGGECRGYPWPLLERQLRMGKQLRLADGPTWKYSSKRCLGVSFRKLR